MSNLKKGLKKQVATSKVAKEKPLTKKQKEEI